MSDTHDSGPTRFPDEWLVAYLDDVLPIGQARRLESALENDKDLQDRLAGLNLDRGAVNGAYSALLDRAPKERLTNIFEAAARSAQPDVSDAPAPAERTSWLPQFFGWGLATSFGVAMIAVGLGTGIVLDRSGIRLDELAGLSQPAEPPKRGWIAAVSDYVALYSPETLTAVDQDSSDALREVDTVTTSVGAPITALDAVLPDLTLRQARLLEFNGKPLAQIMYADRSGNPVAFCIIATDQDDRGFRIGEPNGLSAVNWISDGYHYVVIGDVPKDEAAGFARQFSERTS